MMTTRRPVTWWERILWVVVPVVAILAASWVGDQRAGATEDGHCGAVLSIEKASYPEVPATTTEAPPTTTEKPCEPPTTTTVPHETSTTTVAPTTTSTTTAPTTTVIISEPPICIDNPDIEGCPDLTDIPTSSSAVPTPGQPDFTG